MIIGFPSVDNRVWLAVISSMSWQRMYPIISFMVGKEFREWRLRENYQKVEVERNLKAYILFLYMKPMFKRQIYSKNVGRW